AGVGGLKWPNDLVVFSGGGFRKLGGVLLEAEVLGEELHYALLGVGLNVAEEGLPEGAAGLGRFFPRARRDELLARVLWELERAMDLLDDPEVFVRVYKLHSTTLFRPVHARWVGEPIRGVAVDVEPTGALVVRTRSGRRKRVTAGEVELVGRVSEVMG
ncbi:MAG TPA: bifunctional biotin--[acetyl-CoA-carboxylase] synthetase/biotin operon repressor, partial [Oceanithermus sp.]|nr:bifunctional biotin--[acetyl-CoA-carboxylase] synthetase/biotin operon repressor [Oceanithermus sp.]